MSRNDLLRFYGQFSEQQSHEPLQRTFGDQNPSSTSMFRRYSDFKRERTSLDDEVRAGTPCSSVNTRNIERVRPMIDEDQRIEATLGVGSETVNSI